MNQVLSFNRLRAGKYSAKCEKGTVVIEKTVDGKWYIYFPCGKKSYRQSYEAAKAWANTYLSRTIAISPKKAVTTKVKTLAVTTKVKTLAVTTKVKTLKEKLAQPNSCVVGVEYFGCCNSGYRATIAHAVIKGKSHYFVGKEGNVNSFWIARDLKLAASKSVQVFTNFSDAEKAFYTIDDEAVAYNKRSIAEAKAAKEALKVNPLDLEAVFALNDLGCY